MPLPTSLLAHNSAALSPDGSRVASASNDRTVRVWDAATGRELCRTDGHAAETTSAAFSSCGTRVVSGSWDTTVRSSPARSCASAPGHFEAFKSVAFSPDETAVVSASGDKTVRIWSPDAGEELRRLVSHSGRVELLITHDADGETKAWDAAAWREKPMDLTAVLAQLASASASADGGGAGSWDDRDASGRMLEGVGSQRQRLMLRGWPLSAAEPASGGSQSLEAICKC